MNTKYDEQQSSLDMQINYYKEYINKNKEWEYVDKVKSGTSTKNRIEFNKMIKDCENEKSEQMLTILSSIAQMESENISQNVKWRVKKQFEDGTYKMRNLSYGYKKGENGEIIVDEESIKQIQNNKWQNPTISYIIKNSIYIGELLLQNTYATESFPFKILKNNGEKAKYLIEENHEPIISEELFKKANKIRKKGTIGIHHSNRYEFNGIIYYQVC